MVQRSCLIISDDGLMRNALEAQFSKGPQNRQVVGLSLSAAVEFSAAGPAVGAYRPDLLIVDGADMAKASTFMATQKEGHPILVLAGIGQKIEQWEKAGAIAVMGRPFRLGALLAKVRGLLLSMAAELIVPLSAQVSFHHGQKALVAHDGLNVKLTDKEAMVLDYLARADGGFVAREELLRQVWGYGEGISTHTLETHIYRLRQKIAEAGVTDECLFTDDGGYRLQQWV